MYKSGPDFYIRLFHNNHAENRNQVIARMRVNLNTISTSVNIPVCTSIQDIQATTHDDKHPQELKTYVIQG